jgi:hypothetical protein
LPIAPLPFPNDPGIEKRRSAAGADRNLDTLQGVRLANRRVNSQIEACSWASIMLTSKSGEKVGSRSRLQCINDGGQFALFRRGRMVKKLNRRRTR